MSNWDSQFQQLKSQFLIRSQDRLAVLGSLLQKLSASPSDLALLRQIMQQFHWFSGSGGTFGYDEITQWGSYGEELCDYLLKAKPAVSPDDCSKLFTALTTIQQLFAAQVQTVAHSQEAGLQERTVQSKMRNTVELLVPPESVKKAVEMAAQPSDSSSGSKSSGSVTTASSVGQSSVQPQQNQQQPVRNTGSAPLVAPPMTSVQDPMSIVPPAPVTVAGSNQISAPGVRQKQTSPDGKLALIVDANPGSLNQVKVFFEEREISVRVTATAAEARATFADRLPDFLIVGTSLIDENSYAFAESVRALESGHKPIIVLLGLQAVFVDKVKAIKSGADAFFEYPSEMIDFSTKISAILERDKSEPYKVLSVEDDPDQAEFIKLTLQSAGCRVLHLPDSKNFEEQFLSFEPDLVLLDIVLGEISGFEIAKYIRQSDRFATMPIVFLTTQNKLAQHIRSAMSGGDEHLVKPVAPQLLIATVASRVERSRSLKRLLERDGLTRCLNFGSFIERAQKLAGLDGFSSAPAMMMIDVDNMKQINGRLGFAAGDRIISNIASMLLKGFRNTDMIARFGNDQFAVVLENLNAQQLQTLSAQVLSAIGSTPQLVQGRSVAVTCSAGLALLEQGMSIQDWLDSAQGALKKAKESGGNRAVVKPSSRV